MTDTCSTELPAVARSLPYLHRRFEDERFKSSSGVDKRGRKVSGSKKDDMRRYYRCALMCSSSQSRSPAVEADFA